MLPIETLVQSVQGLSSPVVAPQSVQQQPVKETQQASQPATTGDAAGEFVKALFNQFAGQGAGSPQRPVNAPQKGAAEQQPMFDLSALKPVQMQSQGGYIKSDGGVMLQQLLRHLLGV